MVEPLVEIPMPGGLNLVRPVWPTIVRGNVSLVISATIPGFSASARRSPYDKAADIRR